MKNILYKIPLLIMFLTLSSCCTYAQSGTLTNNLIPFVGNWEWQNGNQKFKIHFYLESNQLKGDYKLVEVNNGIDTIIYSSKVPFGNSGNYAIGIRGTSNDGILLFDQIADYSWAWNGELNKIKYGSLAIEIQPQNGIGQITATWNVSKLKGVRVGDEILEFVIPTDIVLTKVN